MDQRTVGNSYIVTLWWLNFHQQTLINLLHSDTSHLANIGAPIVR